MKRTAIIELGIIVVAIIFGYEAVNSIISIILAIIFSLQADFPPGLLNTIIPYSLYIIIYILSFYLVIKYRNPIARLINGSEDEIINLNIGKKSILHITIIAICLSAFVAIIPGTLIYLFKSFKSSAESYDSARDNFEIEQQSLDFWTDLIKLIIILILLRFSSNIAGYYSKNSEEAGATINEKINEETN